MDLITVLGLTASIAQLIDQTVSLLRCLNDVKNAPQERASLALELTSLLNLFTSLKYRVEACTPGSQWFTAVRVLGEENGALDQFKNVVDDLARILEPTSRTDAVKKALIWPFKKRDVHGILSRIERIKSHINLAFSDDLS